MGVNHSYIEKGIIEARWRWGGAEGWRDGGKGIEDKGEYAQTANNNNQVQ